MQPFCKLVKIHLSCTSTEAIMLQRYGDSQKIYIIEYDDTQKHGWNGDFSLQWVTKILPTEVVRHLTTDETPVEE